MVKIVWTELSRDDLKEMMFNTCLRQAFRLYQEK
jgi:hypothetical protein